MNREDGTISIEKLEPAIEHILSMIRTLYPGLRRMVMAAGTQQEDTGA